MIELIILTLSVYGTSKLLVEYDGYMDVFYKLRSHYEALQCVACTSVYVSVAFSAVHFLGLSMWLLPLAIVGIIVLIDEVTA